MGFIIQFLSQKLVPLFHVFLVSVSRYLLPLYSFISTFIFRLQGDGGSFKNNGKEINFLEAETELATEYKAEKDAIEFKSFDSDAEEEKQEVILKFKFPTFQEFSRIHKETGNSFNSELVHSASTSKYEFTSEKSSVSTFIDKLQTFPVEEINANKTCDFSETEEGLLDEKLELVCNEIAGVHDVSKEFLVRDGEENEKSGGIEFTEKSEEKAESVQEDEEFQGNQDFLDESRLYSGKNSMVNDSESESMNFEHFRSVINSLMDSYSDGFLSDGDFGEEFGENEKQELENEFSGFDENQEFLKDFNDAESDTMEELKKLEEHHFQNPAVLSSDFLSDKDLNAEFVTKYEKVANGEDNPDKPKSKDSSMSDSMDANKLESLWEHQDLIEQLKMELKKVRATGLPTILEESESPKIMDDLKPWKIDEKFQREDRIGELHKFYKSYRERMRKFDILNYQKMYAMGFLQLKDPLQSLSKQKPSAPTLKSLVSQNLWLSKHKTHGTDPMKKFINELQGELEVVYVGQVCLSWEFLHWQYEKALDLWDSDPRLIHRYNEIAGEFQQFQVLMQRFIEDEPFQGPRVHNYVKTRCVLRNLLQVPVIRVDNMKDKKKSRKKDRDDYVIRSDMLVEIVEESIRIFWRFVKADKDCTTLAINTHKKTLPELYNPEDLKLLLVVRKILQKKERKLKDILRSENCILRRFRQFREDDSDQVLSFFSQVDMKLISRVLNMSKITRDQLIWCHNKLNRISFVNRKMCVEPAFLLFPC